jgi:hypothetical protein
MTAVVDRYVLGICTKDVADEIIEIPGDMADAAVNLVKPMGIVSAVRKQLAGLLLSCRAT